MLQKSIEKNWEKNGDFIILNKSFEPYKLPWFGIALIWVKIETRFHFHVATHVMCSWSFTSPHQLIF